MELAKLASKMETQYKNEISTLHNKAEKLKTEKAEVELELGKIRTRLMKDRGINPSAQHYNKGSDIPSLSTGWCEGWNTLGSIELGNRISDCGRTSSQSFDVCARRDYGHDSTLAWTPKSIPKSNLETVWVYPDGKVLQDNVALRHPAKNKEQEDSAKDVSKTNLL